MTKLTKTLSAAVILASIGFGSAANAQTVQMPSAAVAPTHSWALKDTAAQKRPFKTLADVSGQSIYTLDE